MRAVIQELGVQFYSIFANAAGGERDPRCLLKVFSIFSAVMRAMDVGPFMEDMFELVACYYPIEYQPVSGRGRADLLGAEGDGQEPGQLGGAVGRLRGLSAGQPRLLAVHLPAGAGEAARGGRVGRARDQTQHLHLPGEPAPLLAPPRRSRPSHGSAATRCWL